MSLLDFPTEILIRIANLLDYDTLLNVLSLPEIEDLIGGFVTILTFDSREVSYFKNFKNFKRSNIFSINPSTDELYLIEISYSILFNLEFIENFKNCNGIISIIDGHPDDQFASFFIQFKKMNFVLPEIDYLNISGDNGDVKNVIFDFNRLKLINTTGLMFEEIENFSSNSKLYCPKLETVSMIHCSSELFKIFNDETIENIKEIEHSVFTFFELKNLNFKSLEEAIFIISLRDDDEISVFENLNFPNLESIDLQLYSENPFPIIKNINIPKLETVSISDFEKYDELLGDVEPKRKFKGDVFNSLLNFKNVKSWFLTNSLDILTINEIFSNIEYLNLNIAHSFNKSIFQNISLEKLSHLVIEMHSDAEELPGFVNTPNLITLDIVLSHVYTMDLFNDVPVLYPDIEYLSLTSQAPFESLLYTPHYIKPAKFNKLKKLKIGGNFSFPDFELTGNKLSWDLTELEELVYIFYFSPHSLNCIINLDLPNLKILKVINSTSQNIYENSELTSASIKNCPNLEKLEISRVNVVQLSDEIGERLKSFRTSLDTEFIKLEAGKLPVIENIHFTSNPTKSDEVFSSVKEINPKVLIKIDEPEENEWPYLFLFPDTADSILDLEGLMITD